MASQTLTIGQTAVLFDLYCGGYERPVSTVDQHQPCPAETALNIALSLSLSLSLSATTEVLCSVLAQTWQEAERDPGRGGARDPVHGVQEGQRGHKLPLPGLGPGALAVLLLCCR